jgi:hypothetical protein
MTKIQIVREPTSRFGGVSFKKMYTHNFPEGKVLSEYDYLISGLSAVTQPRMVKQVKAKYKVN